MAKAAAQTVTTITLTLDQKEAETLQCILSNVGGHPEHSARRYAEAVAVALAPHVGSPYEVSERFESEGRGRERGHSDAIYFTYAGAPDTL